ncbi:MAG: hypothetical protein AAGD35_11915 [Actinomycetota bacterium]
MAAVRRRARRSSVGLAVVAAVAFVGTYTVVDRRLQADLLPEQDLPADVQTEVDQTWGRFVEVFGPRRRCFDDVSLLLVTELDGGDARYVVPERRIEILIPTSPRRFRESLVHELAHHVEHTCGRFAQFRPRFIALLAEGGQAEPSGSGDTIAWADPDVGWEARPAELWAETVVAVVNGERVRHERTMPLPEGAEALVLTWADGG